MTVLHVSLVQEDRKTLPIYLYRDELLKAVDDHQVPLDFLLYLFDSERISLSTLQLMIYGAKLCTLLILSI